MHYFVKYVGCLVNRFSNKRIQHDIAYLCIAHKMLLNRLQSSSAEKAKCMCEGVIN